MRERGRERFKGGGWEGGVRGERDRGRREEIETETKFRERERERRDEIET